MVILRGRLEKAIGRLNPGLPAEARADAIRTLTQCELPNLLEENRRIHKLLVEGVDVEYFGEDDVLTSGSGGAFPAGLVIGTLTAVQTEAGGQIEYGIVEPQCDLDSLVQVFIIKDFEVVE